MENLSGLRVPSPACTMLIGTGTPFRHKFRPCKKPCTTTSTCSWEASSGLLSRIPKNASRRICAWQHGIGKSLYVVSSTQIQALQKKPCTTNKQMLLVFLARYGVQWRINATPAKPATIDCCTFPWVCVAFVAKSCQ